MAWALPFLVVVGALLPLLAWSSHRYLATVDAASAALPSPGAMALQTIVVQAVVMALAWLALVRVEWTVSWTSRLDAASLLAAAVVVLAGVKLAHLEARRPLGPSDSLRRELRKAGLTKLWLVAISAAAIGEEFAYRGVLFLLLEQSVPALLAALVSALAFGLAHFGQGLRGAVLSALLGLGFQGVALLSGGLFLGILAHFSYDLVVIRFGRRLALTDQANA